MDIFEGISAKPMLIAGEAEAFDSEDYIFELKLDGERCLAYLDADGTELVNKRNVKMISKLPELAGIHRQAEKRCILDGELMVSIAGKPNFDEIKRRSLTSNKFRIQSLSKKYPATFTAFDILYYDDKQITDLPLMERKNILDRAFSESERLARSRFIEGKGVALYELVKARELEGIIAKRAESVYRMGERTRDWVKIKNLKDDDFVVCGYIVNEGHAASVILGQYSSIKSNYFSIAGDSPAPPCFSGSSKFILPHTKNGGRFAPKYDYISRLSGEDLGDSAMRFGVGAIRRGRRPGRPVLRSACPGNVGAAISRPSSKDKLIYKGHVTLGLNREEFRIIKGQKEAACPFPRAEEGAVYIEPRLVAVAKFMDWTVNGGLRQPVFAGLRDDKLPEECIIKDAT